MYVYLEYIVYIHMCISWICSDVHVCIFWIYIVPSLWVLCHFIGFSRMVWGGSSTRPLSIIYIYTRNIQEYTWIYTASIHTVYIHRGRSSTRPLFNYIYIHQEYIRVYINIYRLFAFGVAFNLNLMSQSRWSLCNGTWHKRIGELNHRLRFENEEMTLQLQYTVHDWGCHETCVGHSCTQFVTHVHSSWVVSIHTVHDRGCHEHKVDILRRELEIQIIDWDLTFTKWRSKYNRLYMTEAVMRHV